MSNYDASADVVAMVRDRLAAGESAVELVHFAIQLRDQNRPQHAADLLRAVIDMVPTESTAYYELAFLHRLRGAHLSAASVLARSLPRAGTDARTQVFLAHMLFALGAHPEAEATLAAVDPDNEEDARAIPVMLQMGAYLRAFPLGRALYLLDALTERNRYLQPAAVAAEISGALAQRAPFALVRLGDGEGAALQLGAIDEHAHGLLYARNRAEFSAIWFGTDMPLERWAPLRRSLLSEIADCDLVGIPYATWLEHEYTISSVRGIPSLVNLIRALGDAAVPGRGLCSQYVNVALHTEGHLPEILKRERRISIITCLSELPALLERCFDLQEVTLYRVPGEQGSANLLGASAIHGTHYPDVFGALSSALSVPHHGRLFLVAAGLLGKFYAALVRRHGGVALDIGSLADAWTGRATRPGYDDRLKLL